MSEKHVHNGNLSKMYENRTDEYYTPSYIIKPISKSINGFDLDPCTSEDFSEIAKNSFKENGLKEDWFGDVWLNPPYSDIGPWLEKASKSVCCGDAETVFALVPYRTQTQWFQRNLDGCEAICFKEGCISFGDSNDTAPYGSLILFYGEINEEIVSVLKELGKTVYMGGWFDDEKNYSDKSVFDY